MVKTKLIFISEISCVLHQSINISPWYEFCGTFALALFFNYFYFLEPLSMAEVKLETEEIEDFCVKISALCEEMPDVSY